MSARDELFGLISRLAMTDSADWYDDVQKRIDAHRAEVLAEAAPPCAVCETPIEWVDCPTGGWWSHRTHPDDGHDAQPPGIPSRAEVLTEVLYAIEDPARREGLGWESARDVVRGMICGWNPASAATDCDWDRECPVHGTAETHAVIADVPDDDQPTRAQASADKLRALFAGGCMPAAQYTATRGEPGGDA